MASIMSAWDRVCRAVRQGGFECSDREASLPPSDRTCQCAERVNSIVMSDQQSKDVLNCRQETIHSNNRRSRTSDGRPLSDLISHSLLFSTVHCSDILSHDSLEVESMLCCLDWISLHETAVRTMRSARRTSNDLFSRVWLLWLDLHWRFIERDQFSAFLPR
jgi:hypothetical protein